VNRSLKFSHLEGNWNCQTLFRRILPIKFQENRSSISWAFVCYTWQKEQSDLNRRFAGMRTRKRKRRLWAQMHRNEWTCVYLRLDWSGQLHRAPMYLDVGKDWS